MTKPTRVLVVGATGSIGRLAVDEAIRQGYAVRALVRNPLQTRFDPRAEVFQGDLTNVASLREALVDIDGVVFTMAPTMVHAWSRKSITAPSATRCWRSTDAKHASHS